MKLLLKLVSLLGLLTLIQETRADENAKNYNNSSINPSLGIWIGSAVNVHCYKGFEMECHPYVVAQLGEERVEESTTVIQCTRNPKWEYSLLFSPEYCETEVNILLFQHFSQSMAKTFQQYPEAGYTLNVDNINNMQRNSLRGSLKLDLSRVPPGVNKFWVMLTEIPNMKREYILPTCIELELDWKPSYCKEYSISSGYTQIDGEYLKRIEKLNKTRIKTGMELNLCKPDLVRLFMTDNKQACLKESGLQIGYCLENESKFEFNKKMEKDFYNMILRKYFNLIGYTDRIFVRNYAAYLRFFPQSEEINSEFEKKSSRWGNVSQFGLGIPPGDNSEYLNQIVRDFFIQFDNMTEIQEERNKSSKKVLRDDELLDKRINEFMKSVTLNNNSENQRPINYESETPVEIRENSYPLFIEKQVNPGFVGDDLGNYSTIVPKFLASKCPDNSICFLPKDVAFKEPPPSPYTNIEIITPKPNITKNATEIFECTEGSLCIQIIKSRPKDSEDEEEKISREIKYGGRSLTNVYTRNGLHLLVMKRDPFYKIVREEIFDTHFDRREVERLINTLNNYDENYMVLITSAGVWSGALTWKFSFQLGMLGSMNLQEQQEKLREDYSYQFVFLGRKGLCSNNGAFKLQRVLGSKSPLKMDIDLNNDPRFSFVAPTVKCVHPNDVLPVQDQRIYIGGFNFGDNLKDVQGIQVDKVNCEDVKFENSGNLSCLLKAKVIEGQIDITLANGQKSPSRSCSYFRKYFASVDENGNPVQPVSNNINNPAANTRDPPPLINNDTSRIPDDATLSLARDSFKPASDSQATAERNRDFYYQGTGGGKSLEYQGYMGLNNAASGRVREQRKMIYSGFRFAYNPKKGPYTGGVEVCFTFNMPVSLGDVIFIAVGNAECSDFRVPNSSGRQDQINSLCCTTRPLVLSLLDQGSTKFENLDGTVCINLQEDNIKCSAEPFSFVRQMEKDYAPTGEIRNSLYRKRTFGGIKNILMEHVNSV